MTSNKTKGDPAGRSKLVWLVPVIAGVVVGGLLGSLIAGPASPQTTKMARPSTTTASPTPAQSSRPTRAWLAAESQVTAYLAATSAGDTKAALDVVRAPKPAPVGVAEQRSIAWRDLIHGRDASGVSETTGNLS